MAVQTLLGFVASKKPNLLFLIETMSTKHRMERVRVQLKYDNCLVVEADGISGGLALLWNGGLSVEVVGYSNHYIDAHITSDDDRLLKWRFTGFYGCPKCNRRRESWNLLRYLSSLNNLPWVFMGDFNDLLWEWEKWGRVPPPNWLFRGFGEAVLESGLTNFGFGGCQYTWERRRGAEGLLTGLGRSLIGFQFLEVGVIYFLGLVYGLWKEVLVIICHCS